MLAERLVFLVVVAVAVWFFASGILPKLKLIRNAKPLKVSRFSDLKRRTWRLIKEVLLQTGVIRARPWVGVMHAFVFWGFIAFSVETLNHFARLFGLAFLPADSAYRIVFLTAVSFFTLFGISALGIRRFVLRPKALGKMSYSSLVVAMLIIGLMGTFLLGFLLSENSPAEKINWWAHSLMILGFLALIPRSKHLHIILGPFNVFLKSFEIANSPELDFEKEEFGLVKYGDLDQKNTLDAFSCVECGRCQDRCPAFATGKALDPKQLVLDIRNGLLGNKSDADIVGNGVSSEVLWQCTTCGACEDICPVGVEHLPMIIGMRRGQVAAGDISEKAATVLNALERGNNPWQMTVDSDAIRQLNIPQFEKEMAGSGMLLWTGCAGMADDRYRKVMAATVSLLKTAGVCFGTVDAPHNCGGDLTRRLGNEMVFQQLAASNIELLKSLGVAKIVTACPHCLQTLRNDYRRLGADFTVLHHSEVLRMLLAEGKLELKEQTGGDRVTYHDPCYLGRYNGVYDRPREIIKACGAELAELPRSRDNSFCCGAGGGQMFLSEGKGSAINVERSKEIAGVAAKTVVTGCPFCLTMLKDGLTSISNETQVKDIAEFLAENLKRKEGAPCLTTTTKLS